MEAAVMNGVRHPCWRAGCGATVAVPGYCEKHRREADFRWDKCVRESAAKRGYGRRWREVRRLFLMESPLCAVCGAAATELDHIIPPYGDKDLFWDRDNWQSICTACHRKKTAKEYWKHGKAKARSAS